MVSPSNGTDAGTVAATLAGNDVGIRARLHQPWVMETTPGMMWTQPGRVLNRPGIGRFFTPCHDLPNDVLQTGAAQHRVDWMRRLLDKLQEVAALRGLATSEALVDRRELPDEVPHRVLDRSVASVPMDTGGTFAEDEQVGEPPLGVAELLEHVAVVADRGPGGSSSAASMSAWMVASSIRPSASCALCRCSTSA